MGPMEKIVWNLHYLWIVVQTEGIKGFVGLSLYLRFALMRNDFPDLKTHYERFLFLPYKNYTPSPFLAAYMDFPYPTESRRFKTAGQYHCELCSDQSPKGIRNRDSWQHPRRKKSRISCLFLTFSCVEWYCCVRRSYQQHQIFFRCALRQGFIELISKVSEGQLST